MDIKIETLMNNLEKIYMYKKIQVINHLNHLKLIF